MTIITTRVHSILLQDPTSESEVMLLLNSENRRTRNVPSGNSKNGGSLPLLLHLHGISLAGILAIEGTTDDGK